MNTSIKVLLSAVCGFCAFSATGAYSYGQDRAEARVLSVSDCVQMALDGNKDIKAAQWRATQYTHTKESLKANYFPKFSLQAIDLWGSLDGNINVDIANPIGSYVVRRIGQLAPSLAASGTGSWYLSTVSDRLAIMNPSIDFKVGNVFSAMLMMEQPIYMGGKVKSAYRMGQLGEKMARLGVGISEDEVVVKTYEAYSLAVKAMEMRKVAYKFDSLLIEMRHMVEAAVDNGMVSRADLMKVQSAIGKSELQIHQAENGYRLARMNLCHIIGLPLSSEIELKPLQTVAREGVSEADTDISNRREYDLLQAKAELAGWKVKLEQSNFLPQIGLAVSGGYLNGIRMMNQNVFDNKFHGMAMLSVKVPIFHALEGHHKVLAAKAEYEQAVLERESLNEMISLEIQKAMNELDEARVEAELCSTLFAEAEENLRVASLSYEKGMSKITDLLEVQTQWQKAYAEMVDARHRQALKEISWCKASGKLNN